MTSEVDMQIVNRDGLSAQIYADLKRKIEEFEYKPGDRISEATLAKVYDVSRTPIKHSLSRLENEELIDVRPQRGTYVSKININHVHDFFEIRMLLELSILDEVIAKRKPSLINNLSTNIQAQKNLVAEIKENNDIDAARIFWKLDNDFHKIIFDSVEKGFVWEFIMSQSSQFNRYRLLTASKDEEYLNEKINEHEKIVQFLKGNVDMDPKQLYNEHLFASLETTIQSLKKQYPDYFYE